jgi:hypothetical protein
MFPMFFPRQELSAAKAEDAAASQARPKWSVMGGCITYHVLSCMNTVVICHDNYCIILSDYIYIILNTLVVWRIILSYRLWCATVEYSILSHFFLTLQASSQEQIDELQKEVSIRRKMLEEISAAKNLCISWKSKINLEFCHFWNVLKCLKLRSRRWVSRNT